MLLQHYSLPTLFQNHEHFATQDQYIGGVGGGGGACRRKNQFSCQPPASKDEGSCIGVSKKLNGIMFTTIHII